MPDDRDINKRGPEGELGVTPPGVTQEEIDFYRAERQEDIRGALRHFSKRAVAGFLILLVGLIVAFKVGSDYNTHNNFVAEQNRNAIVQSGRVISVAGCNRDFKSISALRGILIRAQVSIALQHKAGVLTGTQYQRALDYYQKALDAIRLPDCRLAEEVVTDDPTKARPVPEALYPGGPGDPEAKPSTGSRGDG